MSEHDDFYTSEQIDAQVDALLQAHNAPSLDQRMAQDLHTLLVSAQSQENAQALQSVLQRLLDAHYPAANQQNLTQQKTQGRLIFMKKTQERSPGTRSVMRIFATLAAVLVVALLIGSMLIISALAHQQKPTTSTAAKGATSQPVQTAPGIYTNSGSTVYRLDSLTHRLVWQIALKDVAKIVPAGNMVYILQSNQSTSGTNAVVAADADTGKIIWTHPFAEHG